MRNAKIRPEHGIADETKGLIRSIPEDAGKPQGDNYWKKGDDAYPKPPNSTPADLTRYERGAF